MAQVAIGMIATRKHGHFLNFSCSGFGNTDVVATRNSDHVGEKIREREKGLNKNVSSVQNTSGAVGSNLTVSNIRNTIA